MLCIVIYDVHDGKGSSYETGLNDVSGVVQAHFITATFPIMYIIDYNT